MIRIRRWWLAGMILLGMSGALMGWRLFGADDAGPAPPATSESARIARGRYLALAGNCEGCHSLRGQPPYSGGRGIETPFGTVHATNLTPDRDTGLGAWTSDDFWRALHLGRSRDGRLLYPAFPYPDYTRITREDADAIFAWLRTLPPVRQPNRPHTLRFPYNQQAALLVWRALFFRPGVLRDDPAQSAAWNRGAYLVRGLGHCDACHATRNALGATSDGARLSGGPLPARDWYAPSLTSPAQAGIGAWSSEAIVDYLRTGITARAAAMGPMAEVIAGSTRHLSDPDLRAIAVYLKSLPQSDPPAAADTAHPDVATAEARGAALYRRHCADCHGEQGEGRRDIYPALAGNNSVTLHSPNNAIAAVLGGGFPVDSQTGTRPYGMPPFAPFLSDEEIADVLTYARRAWGNQAAAVRPADVGRLRGLAPD